MSSRLFSGVPRVWLQGERLREPGFEVLGTGFTISVSGLGFENRGLKIEVAGFSLRFED